MALVCPDCAYENPDDARFCASCGRQLGTTCSACGTVVPPGARFCPSCGSPLETASAVPSEPVEERRIVSILFADLAGFTSRSDQADPEDVRRTLIPFHTIAKEEIERFGGTLDKFVGDAAMGVFGAPVAHEDDAERAIRAALAIQARTSEMAIPVRAAVNTGEAVVTFATGPQIGENVAGDVVNIASRLQGVAPHGGVAVGEITYRATHGAIDYRELDPVEVKGKAEPLRVWLVEAVRSEAPGRADEEATLFVGRERERGVLSELLDRAIGASCLQMVTIIGDPGIGKTRLVADLRERAATDDARVTWLRGRCLPYGESVTFAPLQHIVRAATGAMRGDDHDTTIAKLAARIEELEARPDEREWLRSRLAPLLGIMDPGGAPPDRAESFAGWIRFLAAEAARRPLILVVEDLHWADPAMLDFLDGLADHARDAPILLVGTARPELFDVRPGWGGGKANATTLTLAPLAEDEMQRLLAGLVMRSVIPEGTQAPLMQSAGGNPLYALEFVRMLTDRGTVSQGTDVALPDSIQALIAARLDSLSPAHRSLLQDAAVIGDHFWAGALAFMNPAVTDIAGSLAELQRRGMTRRPSSRIMEGEEELAFSHGLIRDVAYRQIPRAGRARRHLAVARWLEETAGDHLEDRAEALAHHTTEALSLARSAHLPEATSELQDEARRFLLMAGKRQGMLDAIQAADYYGRALELTPDDHPERSRILRETTGYRWRSGTIGVDEAVSAYEEAVELALAVDDREAAALALRRLYFQLGFRGDTEPARAALERGVELLEGREPTPVLAELYAALAEDEMFAGRSEESLRLATRSLEMPHTDTTAIMTLHIRGNGRMELGDPAGMDDLREALDRSIAAGTALDQAHSYSYLSEWVGVTEGPIRGLELNRASVDICDRRGIRGQGMWARAESLWLLYDAGRWDEILALAETLVPWAGEHGDSLVGSVVLSYRARVLAHRGNPAGQSAALGPAIATARHSGDLQIQAPVFLAAALIEHALGNIAHALEHVREFEAATRDGPSEYRELQSLELLRLCIASRDVELARTIIRDRPVHVVRTELAVATAHALFAEANGDMRGAAERFDYVAERWGAFGVPFEHAHALSGLARCLVALGEPERAGAPRGEGARLFATLGVSPPG